MKRDNIQPMFKSGHDACRFAYAFNHQQYPMTIMSRLMRGSIIGSGRGLYGLDGAAVAGTVKRHVSTLRYPYPDVIGARYEIDYNNALKHIGVIAQSVIPALGTGSHNRRCVLELVMYYFRIPGSNGKPIKLAELADKYGVHASTITRSWRPIKQRIRELESQSQSDIDSRLVEFGLA